MAKKKDYLMDSDRNIFLTGKAGTGKTYLIKQYVDKMESEGKTVLVSAPTGTAAVNAGGETAHSLFGIPVPCYGVSISKVPPSKIKVLALADAIIIDEVSMMRNDTFSFAMRVLKKAEKLKGSKIRVILTGDFSHLPPVVQKKDLTYLKKFGYDTSGYAFTAKEWNALHLKTVELTKIYRQEDGSELAEMLGKVRENDLSCLKYFKQFVHEGYEASDDEIQICGTNAEADEINRKYLESLPGNMCAFQAEKHGRNAAGICDDIVLLKEGAKVMFLVNDVKKNLYQNGSFGYITSINSKCVNVKLENGEEIPVFPYEYKSYSYKITGGNLVKNEIGSIKQIPLKIAKAITIHKSQGKTFDHVVISPNIFASGQLYVALSRVTDPKGLILTSEVKPEHFKDNPIVEEFYKNGFTYEVKKTVKKTASSKTKAVKKSASKTKKKTAPAKKTTDRSKKTAVKPKKTTVKTKKTAVKPKNTVSKTKKTAVSSKKTGKTTKPQSSNRKTVKKTNKASVKKTVKKASKGTKKGKTA